MAQALEWAREPSKHHDSLITTCSLCRTINATLQYLHNVNIEEPRYECLVCRHVYTYNLYGIHITHAAADDESVEEEQINNQSSTGVRVDRSLRNCGCERTHQCNRKVKQYIYYLKNLKKQKLTSQEDVNSGESKVCSDDDESSTLREYSDTDESYVDESEHYSYETGDQHDKHNVIVLSSEELVYDDDDDDDSSVRNCSNIDESYAGESEDSYGTRDQHEKRVIVFEL